MCHCNIPYEKKLAKLSGMTQFKIRIRRKEVELEIQKYKEIGKGRSPQEAKLVEELKGKGLII